MSEEQKTSATLSRRSFLKIAGLVGVAAQAGGMVAAGTEAGKNPESYTGWGIFQSKHPVL